MLNVENLNTLLSNKSDNLYVLCSVEVTESVGKLSVNAPIPSNTITKLCKVINNFDIDRLVIVCRSPLEQYTKPFPYPEALKKIKREIKKELTVFYQNPYPYNVPNFNNNLVPITRILMKFSKEIILYIMFTNNLAKNLVVVVYYWS